MTSIIRKTIRFRIDSNDALEKEFESFLRKKMDDQTIHSLVRECVYRHFLLVKESQSKITDKSQGAT